MICNTPFWFGPDDRRLFGWLHEPDGPVRGAIVLCQPLGYEHLLAYSSFVELGRRAAEAGFLTLRFDYDGTGDSVGSYDDPARVKAWLGSVGDALDLLRSVWSGPVSVVGMRLGAVVGAVAVAARDDVDAIVLWDPCASGRSFLRESRMLHIVGVGVDDHPVDDGSIEVAGQIFTAETQEDLDSLGLPSSGPIAPHVLVLTRSDRPANTRMRTALEAHNTIDWGEATGQGHLLDELSVEADRIPDVAIREMLTWIGDHAAVDEPTVVVTDPLTGTREAVVAIAPDGVAVVERPVHLGPLGLFAMASERADGTSYGRPVICLNYGTAHHIGPNRIWAECARRWAGEGLRVFRMDLSGIGDSPVRDGQVPHRSYFPEAFDDIVDTATALNPADPHDVTLVGVCSSAYLAIDVATLWGVTAVCPINVNLRYEPPDLLAGDEAGKRALPPSRHLIRRLSKTDIGERAKDRLPAALWSALDALHIHPSPTHAIEKMVDDGVDVWLMFGDDNLLVMLRNRSALALRRLARHPNFHLEVVEGLDHLLMLRRHRARAVDALTAHLLEIQAPARPRTDMDRINVATWTDAETHNWYEELRGWSDPGEAALLGAAAPLVRGMPVLDIGVGSGRTIAFMRLLTDDYVAIDYAPGMVDFVRRFHPDVDVRLADARDLSQFDDGRFGFVYFAYNGIDVVAHEDRARIFSEVHRVLRPGGVFAFSSFNKDGPGFRAGPWVGERFEAPAPYRLLRWFGRFPFTLRSRARMWRNWWHNRTLEVDEGDWGIRTMNIHECGVVAHFQTIGALRREIDGAGFDLEAMFDAYDGTPIPDDVMSSETSYVHVLTRRRDRAT